MSKLSGKGRSQRRAVAAGAVLVALLICAAVPIETQVSPAWRARVAAAGPSPKPLSNCRVTQSWQHYTFQSEGLQARKSTDSEGRVEFPRRSVKATLLERTVGGIWNLRDGVHAS